MAFPTALLWVRENVSTIPCHGHIPIFFRFPEAMIFRCPKTSAHDTACPCRPVRGEPRHLEQAPGTPPACPKALRQIGYERKSRRFHRFRRPLFRSRGRRRDRLGRGGGRSEGERRGDGRSFPAGVDSCGDGQLNGVGAVIHQHITHTRPEIKSRNGICPGDLCRQPPLDTVGIVAGLISVRHPPVIGECTSHDGTLVHRPGWPPHHQHSVVGLTGLRPLAALFGR